VAVGDEVAAWLPSLGGYGEYALAAAWTRKPPQVTWNHAGELPASVEAAVGVLARHSRHPLLSAATTSSAD